jgi:hypothetical protein
VSVAVTAAGPGDPLPPVDSGKGSGGGGSTSLGLLALLGLAAGRRRQN